VREGLKIRSPVVEKENQSFVREKLLLINQGGLACCTSRELIKKSTVSKAGLAMERG